MVMIKVVQTISCLLYDCDVMVNKILLMSLKTPKFRINSHYNEINGECILNRILSDDFLNITYVELNLKYYPRSVNPSKSRTTTYW